MDGEKDPRNLLVAFQIVRDIIVKGYVLGKSVLARLVTYGKVYVAVIEWLGFTTMLVV